MVHIALEETEKLAGLAVVDYRRASRTLLCNCHLVEGLDGETQRDPDCI